MDEASERRAGSVEPAVWHGLRLSSAVCLALLVAFWLQLDNAYWAGTTATVVAQPALGASLRRGRLRAIGTLAGGVAIVVLIALFPQDHVSLLASLALWAALCGVAAAILPSSASYAAALAGFTAAIIFGDVVESPQTVFMVAVSRTTEIGIGILSVRIVHSLTNVGRARGRLQEALASIGRDIARGAMATLLAPCETLELRNTRRQLISRVIALDAIVDEAIGEPSDIRYQLARVQVALDDLLIALSAWRAIASHLGADPSAASNSFVRGLSLQLGTLSERDWLENLQEIRTICEEASQSADRTRSVDLSSRLLMTCGSRLLAALLGVAGALDGIRRSGHESPIHAPKSRAYTPDLVPALLDSVRTVLAIGAAATFWIATAWPKGPLMITFTTISVILFARLGHQAYSTAVQYALGSVLAGVLAAIWGLIVLPRIHGGMLALSMTLGLLLVPLGTLAARAWHKSIFVPALAIVIPILAIENRPLYDAAALLNNALAITFGAALGAIFFGVLPPMSPARRSARLGGIALQRLRRLLDGRWRISAAEWRWGLYRCLAALPPQASLEEEAELLTVLSVGEAAIALHDICRADSGEEGINLALRRVAEGRIGEAQAALSRFAASQSKQPRMNDDAAEPQIEAAAQATLIGDALHRHPLFFARGA